MRELKVEKIAILGTEESEYHNLISDGHQSTNFNENSIDLDAPDKVQEKQVIKYIESLSRGRIHSFYNSYMESYGVIEDLMILNDHNRIELIHRLTGRKVDYLELINREVLN